MAWRRTYGPVDVEERAVAHARWREGRTGQLEVQVLAVVRDVPERPPATSAPACVAWHEPEPSRPLKPDERRRLAAQARKSA